MIRNWNQLSSPRIIQVSPGCLQIRGRIVHHYALMEEDAITLIDGGFLTSTPRRTLAELEKLGYGAESIRAILVSHGHIDHTLHLREWKHLTGAKIYAPEADRDHILGLHRYQGASRVVGTLEALARRLLRYHPPEIDHWFRSGDQIPAWGGIDVIGLPGHTPGHSGFYSHDRQLLFANDLFAHWGTHSHWPPFWLNDDSGEIKSSAREAILLPLQGGILLNHCDESTSKQLLEELTKLLSH